MYRHQIGALSRGGVLDVGLKCSHSCKFCYYSFLDGSKEQFRGIRQARFRSLEECKTILKLMKEQGFINFDYTGGEPTLHPDIIEITRYAHQDLGLKGRIITLGQFLMKKMQNCRHDRLIEDLLEAGLVNFLFSMHAMDEALFKKITGASLAKLRAAMDYLDHQGFQYTGNTTVFEWNYQHLPQIAGEIVKHGVYLHNFILMNAYYQWNRDGRACGVQARYADILPYLKEAVDLLEAHQVAVNIRYAPMCAVRGMERNLVGMVGVRYDPYEWMNNGGHMGGTPELSAARIPLQDGEIEGHLRYLPRQGCVDQGVEVIGARGELKWFGKNCRTCRARGVCDGIDPNYLKFYGPEEFIPYKEPEQAPLQRSRIAYRPAFLVKTEQHEDIKTAVSAAFQQVSQQAATGAQPLVSVIIPCYNYARYLQAAVASVIEQTYQNLEIIIVNDGSTDNTIQVAEELIARHPQQSIRLINQPNSGQPAISRNRGIAESRGQYLLCLDADDLIAPTMIEECLEVLETDPGVAIAYTDRLDFDGVDQVVYAGEYNFSRLRYANHISYCALFRREAWDAVGGYRTNVKGVEDWDFWVAAGARNFQGRRIPKPLFKYRRHDTGVFQDVVSDFHRKAAQVILNNPEVYLETDLSKARALLGETAGSDKCEPLVSVIIPTYNRPESLLEAVHSVLAQTYPHYEIIVINDGGPELEHLLAPLNRRGNIVYLRHGRNRERSAARNSGIRLARGKYLAYLDDDDLFYPDHLETLVTFLENNPYQVAYTDAHRAHQVKQHGKYVVTHKDQPYTHDFDLDHLFVVNQFPTLCLMHEKSCLEKAGFFDESLGTHEDWDLWIRLALHYPFSHIQKTTCEFAWRQDGSTTTSQKNADFIRTMEIIHARYQDHLQDKPQVREQQRQFLQHLRKSRKCSETSSSKLLEEANAAVEREDWETAERCLRQLMQSYPDLLEPSLTLSDILTLQRKHQEAAEVLRAARQVDPESLPLLKRLGVNCRLRGDLSGAMAAFTKYWNQNPGDPEVLSLLGATCIDLGLFQEAQGYFKGAAQINPGNIEAWIGLARVAQHQKDQEEFTEACCRAAALNADHPRLRELTKGLAPGNGGTPPSSPSEGNILPQPDPGRGLSSIIIPVFNNLALTRQCLESINRNTASPHEIIVVDNGSSDGTRDYLCRLENEGEIRVITNRNNLGFARASNQGAQAALGEFLVFLNNDTIVQPGWLEEMLACAGKDDKIGAVGAKLLYPDDSIQHAGVVFDDRKLVCHIYQRYDKDHPAVNKERAFQAVTAACMLIKKDLFFAAGAFNEDYRNGYEDVDLCFNLREQGYKIIYNPRAAIYHLESNTPGRHDRDKENFRIFRSKWSHKIIPDFDKYHQEDDIIVEILERQGNVDTIKVHDGNDNFFWREAKTLRRQGNLEAAKASYFRALRFNPFDIRIADIAQELGDLYESLGENSKAKKFHHLAASQSVKVSLPRKPGEAQQEGAAAI